MKFLILALILVFVSCDKNKPTASFMLRAGYLYSKQGPGVPQYRNDSLACCYDNIIDMRASTDVFSIDLTYLCDGDTISRKIHFPIDTVYWTKKMDPWIKLTVTDDNGNTDTEIQSYKVR